LSCRFESSQGYSTLHEVAYGFDLLEMEPIKGQVVELLVDFGAAVEDLDPVSRSIHGIAVGSCLIGFVALSSAVMRTWCTTSLSMCVLCFILNLAESERTTSQHQEDPLDRAIACGNHHVCRSLLRCGANPNRLRHVSSSLYVPKLESQFNPGTIQDPKTK